jgi:phosphohistidine phosphatase SixA
MKRVILVRYGEYTDDGHLGVIGQTTMARLAVALKPAIQGRFKIIAADLPRAKESAEALAMHLESKVAETYPDLMAAEEEGINPNVVQAARVLLFEGRPVDTLVVVLSREYVEDLPPLLLNDPTFETPEINRGQALVLNIADKSTTIINGENDAQA